MKIIEASVYTCAQPLKIPFRHASSGLVTNLDGVYVKLTAEDGTYGFGEVRGNCSYFTGDTTGAVVSTICTAIAPKLVGLEAENLNRIHQVIENSVVANTAAKDACDCAAYDLAGKLAGKPVYELLGGKLNDTLPSEENIPFMSVEEAKNRAAEILDSGCRFVKVRVGADDFGYDKSRVKAVWEVICDRGLEGEVVYSVDANQAWTARDAIRNINRLVDYGVSIVEQPVKYNSPIRLKELKDNCPVKLFGDECVATVEDFARYIEMGAIDGIHIKLIKCGGISNAVKLMTLATVSYTHLDVYKRQNQKAVMDIIYKGVKAGNLSIDVSGFEKAMDELFGEGAEVLVLGCTELPVAFELFHFDKPNIDPTMVLAAAAVRFVGAKVKEEVGY